VRLALMLWHVLRMGFDLVIRLVQLLLELPQTLLGEEDRGLRRPVAGNAAETGGSNHQSRDRG
jgi:hypothetical protein